MPPRSRRSTPRRCCAQLAAQLQRGAAPAPLRWIRAQVGQTLRLIPVDEIDYLRSDAKYTLIAWRGDAGQPGEALIRTPLKDLVAQLDPAQFAQVHRSVVVNLRAISHVTRGDNETAGHPPEGTRRKCCRSAAAICICSGRCDARRTPSLRAQSATPFCVNGAAPDRVPARAGQSLATASQAIA